MNLTKTKVKTDIFCPKDVNKKIWDIGFGKPEKIRNNNTFKKDHFRKGFFLGNRFV